MEIALAQEFFPDDPLDAFHQGLTTIKDAANAGADLVIFPELSFTPFYPRVPLEEQSDDLLIDLAEPMPGPTTESVAEAAAEYGVVVLFNMLERDDGVTYNTTPVIDADGTVLGCTRMMHVPEYRNCHGPDYYTPGDTGAPVYDTAVGRVGVANGYDRHYPEYLRALAMQDAEVVAVPQAGTSGQWPEGMYKSEIQVGSFQHGFFMAMANRVGQERNVLFDGRSLVTDPSGRVVADAPSGNAIILMASIDLDKCADAPARGHFLPGRRPEEYEQGAVRLAKSDPVHTEALEDYDGEASSDGEAGSKDEATPASSADD
jgi:N-carbamoylputrescine amidase